MQIDWTATAARAAKMTDAGLHYAMLDCAATAKALGDAPMQGKDSGYYLDELSVYRAEQMKRRV
jgi:hypothetical protein